MSTLKADTIQAATTNGSLSIATQGTGGIAIDGMPHKNLLMNGSMAVAQRGTSFANPGNGSYTLDRWRIYYGSAGVVTVTQDTDTPTVAEAGTDFVNSLKVDVTTADASIGAGDWYTIQQRIEGLNWGRLGFGATGASSITISFWVKSPKTGTHTVSVRNSASNRSYPAEYSVSSADTWEKKSVTIAGDTTGTWLTTNGIGAYIDWALAVGSTYHGTGGTWEAASDVSTSNQVNCMDNTANNFFLTGVQLEAGGAATDFEHPSSYGSELLRCRRYYYRVTTADGDMAMLVDNWSTTAGYAAWHHYTEMRTTPTFGRSGATDFLIYSAGGSDNTTAVGANSNNPYMTEVVFTVSSGLVAGDSGRAYFDGGGTRWLEFDAEL